MQEVTAFVTRDADACWRAFVDPNTLVAWVPGLRRARVIQSGADGLPTEILFEFGESLTYTLAYTYDRAAREVKWQPRAGKRDAVAGFARFTPFEGGTKITYALEHGGGRSPGEAALGDLTALLASFQQWVAAQRRV